MKNFFELLDELNEKHGGAAYTFCTPSEKLQLIDAALADGEYENLPSSWKEELE